MRKTFVTAAVGVALLAPLSFVGAGTASAQLPTGSAEIPPSCVGKIDPLTFYIQSLFGTQPRACL
ncbi:hypothetical protein ACWDSJ_19160 [Nocardia sp. NPDC003482]